MRFRSRCIFNCLKQVCDERHLFIAYGYHKTYPSVSILPLFSSLLTDLYHTIYLCVKELMKNYPALPVCLVVDDCSLLLSLGLKVQELVNFVHLCHFLLCTSVGYCKVSFFSPPTIFLVHQLCVFMLIFGTATKCCFLFYLQPFGMLVLFYLHNHSL